MAYTAAPNKWLALGQSSVAEKSYVHQVGSTEEAVASSEPAPSRPLPPFHPRGRPTGQQRILPGLSFKFLP